MSVSPLGMERMSPAFNMFLSGNKFPVVPPRSLDTEAKGSAEDQFMATAERFTMAAKAPNVAEVLDQIARSAPEASAGLNEMLGTVAKELGTEARLVPGTLLKAASALPLPEFEGVAGMNIHAIRPDGTASPTACASLAFDTTPGQNGIIFLIDPNP